MDNESTPNYVVITQSFKGMEVTNCSTTDDVLAAVGRMTFGGLYQVHSPKGLPTDEFVPF